MTERTRQIRPHDSGFARAVAEFCSRDLEVDTDQEFGAHTAWKAVRESGSELWLDSGDLDANREVWTREFSGLTTNNTLLNKEVQKGIMDHLVPEAVRILRRADPALSEEDLVFELAFILNAIHARSLVLAFDADVSVELHTDLVWDAEASYEYGRRYHALCPERFVVKIALTPEGLLAAHRLERDGVRVNCTLGFSPRQNHLIARVARPHFVNVFLGRINAFFEQSGIRADPQPGTISTIASQQMLRELIRHKLAERHTRQIAASIREGSQVAALAGVDVLTVPVSAAREFAASGIDPDRIKGPPALDEDALEPHTAALIRVGDESLAAAEQLLIRNPDTLDASAVRAVLRDSHLGDLFPELDAEDRERIASDGKIPDREKWESRVEDRTASWDGLLTEAAIASFAADQARLDNRIRQLLG